jgi:hypothetical protein
LLDFIFHIFNIIFPIIPNRRLFDGRIAESIQGRSIQLGTFANAAPALEDRTGERKACLFTAFAAIRLVEDLKDLHDVFGLWHDVPFNDFGLASGSVSEVLFMQSISGHVNPSDVAVRGYQLHAKRLKQWCSPQQITDAPKSLWRRRAAGYSGEGE